MLDLKDIKFVISIDNDGKTQITPQSSKPLTDVEREWLDGYIEQLKSNIKAGENAEARIPPVV